MTRRAFTLIELLVVVAVVGVLVGLLVPALARARDAARTSVCMSNLRQLATAQQLYSLDNDGRLVHYGLAEGDEALDADRSWFGALSDYYDTPLVLRSPADNSPYWSEDQVKQLIEEAGGLAEIDGVRLTSYGLNDYVSDDTITDPQTGRSTSFNRIDRIPSPTATVQWVMMTFGFDGESFFGEFATADHVHPDQWWVNDPSAPPFLAATMVEINAHGGPRNKWDARANYGFLDGHAATLRFREVYETNKLNQFDPRVAR